MLKFADGSQREAYRLVSGFEPEGFYEWAVTKPLKLEQNVNILRVTEKVFGEIHIRGGSAHRKGQWSHRSDPVFHHGLAVIRETLNTCGRERFRHGIPSPSDWSRFFTLQMAYLLLWAAIERYATFAFGPSSSPGDRTKKLGELPAFQQSVKEHVTDADGDVVTDSRNFIKSELDNSHPAECADYFYQIRNNLSHRGKTASYDFERVRQATWFLVSIFEDLLGPVEAA